MPAVKNRHDPDVVALQQSMNPGLVLAALDERSEPVDPLTPAVEVKQQAVRNECNSVASHALYAGEQNDRAGDYYNTRSFTAELGEGSVMRSMMPAASNCQLIFSASDAARSRCPNCCFNAWCLPANLTPRESQKFNERIEHRRLIKRNEYLNYAGTALTSLFVINSGFLKTRITSSNGREQITGFSMAGEVVGMNAIGEGRHRCDTTALVDSHLCGISYFDFEQIVSEIPALQRHFHRAMSAEIAGDHGIMLLLGAMRAEERVAEFLLNFSRRHSARGYSGTRFALPMTRQDIASYLGLKMETVSRVLSHLHNAQVIAINNKDVEIRNSAQLQRIAGD